MQDAGTGRMILIVKSTKEVAVTAELRRSLRFYLVPLRAGDVGTCGVVTAFFDDRDEPLTIRTPLFEDEFGRAVLAVLSSETFDLHFFDQRNRELLGFRAENPDAARFRSVAGGSRLVPGNLEVARQLHDDMTRYFGARSAADDKSAFTVRLVEALFPHNLDLDSQNPGDSNERDIAAALQRSFGTGQVYRNPTRADNGREFVDVLVATEESALLIQAKDSPASEASVNRSLGRKRSVSLAHVRKAASQLKGSIRHLQSDTTIELIDGSRRREVSVSGRAIFGLVIVEELFDPDRSACSPFVFAVFEELGVPCVLLDYTEFQQLTFFRRTEESVMTTLAEIFAAASEHGVFPRSRFGLRADGPVVYSPEEVAGAQEATSGEPATAVWPVSDGTSAVVVRDGSSGKRTGVAFQRSASDDRLRVIVDRREVEAVEVSRAGGSLLGVVANRETVERFRGRVDLAFHGYAGDPREVYEIPEVRRFCTKLDEVFPYWFYFLSPEGVTLMMVACCLCAVRKVKPGLVSFGPDLLPFMSRHFRALNWLVDNYSLDESENIEISRRVTEYFGGCEPMR